MRLKVERLEIIYLIFTFTESAGHGVGHLIGPRDTWGRFLNSDTGRWFIGVLTRIDEAAKNDKIALEKRLLLIREEHLKTHQYDYDYNITSDLNTIFNSVEDINPKMISRMMPSVKRLMGKAEGYLNEEETKLKEKLKDALKLLMTEYRLSVDSLENETDVSRFWDVIGTYFVNSRKIGNTTSKSEDSQRERVRDLHFGLGLGLGVLVLLCAAGAVVLFCTKDGHGKHKEDGNKSTDGPQSSDAGFISEIPQTVMESYRKDKRINTVLENGFIVPMAPEKFDTAKLTSVEKAKFVTSSPVAPQFRVSTLELAAGPPQPTTVSV